VQYVLTDKINATIRTRMRILTSFVTSHLQP